MTRSSAGALQGVRTGPQPLLQLDHVAFAGRSLAQAVTDAEAALGVAIPVGGAHPLMATHNHLLAVGERGSPKSCFLEIIAPDAAVPSPGRPRWFGLDRPPDPPRLVTWVVRTSDLDAALSCVAGARGPAIEVSRGSLSWRIGVPDDGSMPFDGAFPTVIAWPVGVVPSDAMPQVDCRLTRLEIAHPRADEIAASLAPWLEDPRLVFVTAPRFRLAATFDTPAGSRTLA